MKKWLLLMLVCLGLVSCTSETNIETQNEKLHSFLIAKNKLYVVGELHDYEFEHQLVDELNQFLGTPLANHIKDLSIDFSVRESPNVQGRYRVVVAKKSFTAKEKEQLDNALGFTHQNDEWIKTYQAEGKLVKLGNRDELLQKFRFKEPLTATLKFYQSKKSVDVVGIALIPIGIVVAVPFYMYWFGNCLIDRPTGGC